MNAYKKEIFSLQTKFLKPTFVFGVLAAFVLTVITVVTGDFQTLTPFQIGLLILVCFLIFLIGIGFVVLMVWGGWWIIWFCTILALTYMAQDIQPYIDVWARRCAWIFVIGTFGGFTLIFLLSHWLY